MTDATLRPLVHDDLYPIRTVSQLTGVHPVTLRAWERRYGLLRPRRTDKGHRLYNDADVERIRKVLALLDDGVPVSRVRPLLDEADASTPDRSKDAEEAFAPYVRRMLAAVESFDEPALDAAYNDALSLYSLPLVSTRITAPVLDTLGERWREGEAGIAREHFFSTFLRNKIGARLNHVNRNATGPRVVAACPTGEHHELGIMQFSLAAATAGYRVVLIGSDLPVEQIAAAARIARCAAVVLSVSSHHRAKALREKLTALAEAVRQPVLVGGDGSVKWRRAVDAAGAVAVGTDIPKALAALNRAVRTQ